MEKDLRFMKEALKEAEKARGKNEVPIGAVVVVDDEIIGRGHNERETRQRSTAHAEIIAIEKACEVVDSWRLEDATIYVTLEPCPMCAGAIILSRIKRLVYGAKDNKNGAHVSSDVNVFAGAFNHRVAVEGGLEAEKSRKIIKDFFLALRNGKSEV